MMSQARGARASDAPAEVDLERVVQRLRAIDSAVGWERTLAIGELVVSSLFDGHVQALNRNRKAQQSLRRLAEHELCPLRKSALAEALRVYNFICENPEVRSFNNVAPGHVALVLKCGSEQRVGLLLRAQQERLTVRAFAQLVSSVYRPESPARAAANMLAAVRRIDERLGAVRAFAATSTGWSADEAAKVALLLANLEQLLLRATNASTAFGSKRTP